jgi:cell division septum initiation protein DivIVA
MYEEALDTFQKDIEALTKENKLLKEKLNQTGETKDCLDSFLIIYYDRRTSTTTNQG